LVNAYTAIVMIIFTVTFMTYGRRLWKNSKKLMESNPDQEKVDLFKKVRNHKPYLDFLC
jgi:hypothetical protein